MAARRLLRNRSAIGSLVVLLVIVLAALAAPIYAHDIADTDPLSSNLSGTTVVHGKRTPVIAPNPSGLGSSPIGPRRYSGITVDRSARLSSHWSLVISHWSFGLLLAMISTVSYIRPGAFKTVPALNQ